MNCWMCDGSGQIELVREVDGESYSKKIKCPVCEGPILNSRAVVYEAVDEITANTRRR